MANNAETVANALKSEDNPAVPTPELDPESAQLLELFEEIDNPPEETPPEEPAPAEPSVTEDGTGETPKDTASPTEPPPDSGSSPDEPAPVASPVVDLSAPADVPAPQPTATPEVSAEDQAKQRQDWRVDALAKVEKHYASQLEGDEMRDMLLAEPEKALPKIFANAYMDMYDSLMGGVTQAMPQQVKVVMDQQEKSAKDQADFFSRWPKLEEAYSGDAEKQKTINRTIQSYRVANPNATMSEAIEEAGAMAMVALRIPVEVGKNDTSSAPAATTKGFKPASPGGGAQISSPAPAPKKLNEFETLAQELLEDDEV